MPTRNHKQWPGPKGGNMKEADAFREDGGGGRTYHKRGKRKTLEKGAMSRRCFKWAGGVQIKKEKGGDKISSQA